MSKLKEKALHASEMFASHRGYKVLDTAYKAQNGEQLDMVLDDEGTIVFVEVLARSDSKKGFPSERMDDAARKRLEDTALCWLAEHANEVDNTSIRFDIMSLVVFAESRALIRHHINALGHGISLAEPDAVEEPVLAAAAA